jgi:hypothetical protein
MAAFRIPFFLHRRNTGRESFNEEANSWYLYTSIYKSVDVNPCVVYFISMLFQVKYNL